MGQDSIVFHTEHFEQKYFLTGCIHLTMDTWPTEYDISFDKSDFRILSVFLRILYVYDFCLSMFYLTEQLKNAYIKSLDSIQ